MSAAEDPDTRRAWLDAADAGAVDELRRLYTLHPQLLNYCARHLSLKASTALHLCAWRNHAPAAEFLLQVGADVEARDEAGMTPLQIDILRVCMEKMRPIPLLRSRCIDVTSPVALARFKRKLTRDRSTYHQIDTTTLEVLLKHNANVNSFTEVGESALLLAVDDGLIKHVKILLDHGADPFHKDKSGRMSLDLAAEHGYADVVELLVRRYPDLIASAGVRALRGGIGHDSVEVLSLLFDQVLAQLTETSDRTKFGGELFQTAIEYDAPGAAGFFLDRGVAVDWINEQGETAMHVACRFSRPDLLGMLLGRAADGNRRSLGTGLSAYHMVVQRHGFSEIEVLARHSVNINILDRNDNTPLGYAAKNGFSVDLMEVLIGHGAHFLFPTAVARDAVAPILASWFHNLAPEHIPALVHSLLVAGCVDHERARCVISSLIWSRHNEEALLFVFLALFSSSVSAAHEALLLMTPWLDQHRAHVVVHKLAHDALRR